MKSSDFLPLIKEASRRSRASRGERVMGALFPNRAYGYGAFGASDRSEMVQHLKNWTNVAVTSICRKMGQLLPNMAYVHNRRIPGRTQKWGDSDFGAFGGTSFISEGPESWVTMGSLRHKAQGNVVKPHEELEPLEWDHPCRRLIENPNPMDTSFDLLYELDMFMELCGIAYLWAIPNDFGMPSELWVIPSHWVWPRTGGSRYVRHDDPNAERLIHYYEIRPWGGMGSAGMLKFPPEEVLAFPWKSPLSKIDGYSNLAAIAQWIDTEESITKSKWAQFNNQAMPSLWVELGADYEDPTDDQIARVEAKIVQKFQGELNQGKPIITPPGCKLTPLSFNPEQMMYFQSEEQIRDMILSAFQVPKAVVGISNDMTFGSILATMASFCSNCLNPRLAMLGQRLTKFLAPRFRVKDAQIRIWWDDCSPADPTQVNADISADLQANSITPNEVRAIRGRKPYKHGGDDPMVSGPGGIVPLPLNTGDDLTDLASLVPILGEAQQSPEEQAAAEGEQPPGAGQEQPKPQPGTTEVPVPTAAAPEKPNGPPSKGWQRIGPSDLRTVIDGVEIRLVNLTGEVGRRHWNLGVMEHGGVNWVESGSTRAEMEAMIPVIVRNELERRFGQKGWIPFEHRKDLGPHTYSSTQVQLPEDLAARIRAFAAAIPDEDLAGKGREDDVHATVKYGLHTADAMEVSRVVHRFGEVELTLGKTSIFPAQGASSQRGGEQYDVLKIDVGSADLKRLNALICRRLEYTDTYPVYVPHVTVAYIKPGFGSKYAGSGFVAGEKVTATELVFSDPAGKRTSVSLLGDVDQAVLLFEARRNGHQKVDEELMRYAKEFAKGRRVKCRT